MAYVGTAVRGVQGTTSMPPFGQYAGKAMFQITIYANGDGETLSFTYLGGGVATSLLETLIFMAKRSVGSVVASFSLTNSPIVSSSPPPAPLPPGQKLVVATTLGMFAPSSFSVVDSVPLIKDAIVAQIPGLQTSDVTITLGNVTNMTTTNSSTMVTVIMRSSEAVSRATLASVLEGSNFSLTTVVRSQVCTMSPT